MLHRMKRLLIAALIGITLGSLAASYMVAEGSVHIWQRPQPDPALADNLTHPVGATWEPVQVNASDGAVLSAWLFTPLRPNGSAVILLHGVGDTRAGSLSAASFLMRAGFTALTPDCRGHGASGGSFISYGIRETGDVRAWTNWLFDHRPVERLYGWGASMGAAILLQSLPVEPRFRALVADSPFATFEEVAYDRLSLVSGIWRPAFWPVVNIGLVYTKGRYGLDLRQASPADAVRATRVPILLIHGTRDTHIPVRHSRELRALNPGATEFWEVPGSEHVESLSDHPEEYARRVTEWFRRH
jgi:uncharacterized protein